MTKIDHHFLVTPLVTAPADTNPSDATDVSNIILLKGAVVCTCCSNKLFTLCRSGQV